ncbi:MAG: NAD(P)-dependent oxidoreductase [Spirochaetes bacterium]|nr:NAD(P)-dependent oxidoreductase [Spirochaetota bacterium]
MRIFITGGTGFIGRHTVKKLREDDHELLILTRMKHRFYKEKNISITHGNLSNMESWWKDVLDFRPDAVLHMAWEDIPNYDYKTSLNNLQYGLDLVYRLAESRCRRIVCTGSCWEYGRQKGTMKEDDTPHPVNSFTAAKVSLHTIGKAVAKENNTQWLWLRLFYVYGPGQREGSLIPYIISSLQDNKNPKIKTPENKNDFVYVEDVAEAIAAVIRNPNAEGVYNIGEGKSTSIKYILQTVYREFGRDFITKATFREEPNVDFWADTTKIKAETGWESKTRIEEGISRTVRSYE